MISNLPIPTWSQRNPAWANQRLGTKNGTTIGSHGCLITSLAMMNAGFDPRNQLTPNQVDDIFTNKGGYSNGNLVIWNKINQLLANCGTAGVTYCTTVPAPIAELRSRLDQGQLAVLQVGFGGNANAMHFVLAVGYDGDNIIFHDPWWGDRSSFSSKRYGTGSSSRDILAIHYFSDSIPEPVKPAVPVAKPAAAQPLLGFQRRILKDKNANYRKAPNTNAEVIKKFDAGLVLDFKGFVRGQNVNDSDIWFVGRYSDGYVHSSCFEDRDTHDLPDLTPPPAAPTPEPAPAPTPEPTPEPEATPIPVVVEPTPEPEPEQEVDSESIETPEVENPVETVENSTPEWERTWREDTTIPRKVVAVPSADVVDFDDGGKSVMRLNGGTLVAPLAGYFQANGLDYVRTQTAVDKGWWKGILLSELKDAPQPEPEPTPEPPVNPSAPVDAIQPPSDVPGSIFDDPQFEDPDAPEDEKVGEPRIPLSEIWKSFSNFAMGILLSPLRLVGRISKYFKGARS